MALQSITNIRSTDRVLTLEPIDDKPILSTSGHPDKRIFTGDQQLHIKMDPETCLWYFQYSGPGLLPGGLEGRYTGFKAAIKFAEMYYKKRNIRIKEVKD